MLLDAAGTTPVDAVVRLGPVLRGRRNRGQGRGDYRRRGDDIAESIKCEILLVQDRSSSKPDKSRQGHNQAQANLIGPALWAFRIVGREIPASLG